MTDTPSTPEGDPTVPTPGSPGDATDAYPPAPGADAYPPAETIGSPARSGASRGVVIGIGAAVLALIAGAAIYATTALSGGGRQPDELAPKATFAYAKIDLDPAANQKLAAREFFGKFPKVKKPGSDGNVFETLLEQAFTDEESGLDYNTDIKPWFDKRAAVAAFNGAGGPEVVGIIRSKDDGKAKAALDKALTKSGNFAYRISKGYVLIGDEQSWVDDAVTMSSQESLADNDVYTKDVERLSGDQVVVGWVDARSAFNALKSQIPDAGLLPNALTDQITGRFVTGVHLNGDYVELSGLVVGQDQKTTTAAASEQKLLANLPANTVAAISVNGLGDQIKNALSQLSGLGGLGDPDAIIGDALEGTGLTFDDIVPLLGEQTVLSLGAVPEDVEGIAAALISTVKDPATARTNGDKLAKALSQMGVPVESDVAGSTFYLATTDYLGEVKSGKGLGSTEKFTKAVGSGSYVSAAYVDLESLIAAFGAGEDTSDVSALKSIGVVAGYDKGVGFFRMRVVAL